MTWVLTREQLDAHIGMISILLVDDNHYMRKIVRTLLNGIGIKKINEAVDGVAGLEAIRVSPPDIVILDWDLPLLNGGEFVRIVRSPGLFPMPDLPIIMLSSHGERSRVVEAIRLGVNEYLRKPVSAKMLFDRICAILTNPRPIVRIGDYYGPQPRRTFGDPTLKLIVAPPGNDTPIN
jgi:two-component system chemotaxis response regulator CheY